ncbi:MutS-related protein [Arachidicoccus terrestris]|uniref:MutS-related protein n=1 Tax=Arachidicoccus terrestris TaxID=2875539 RepID=UPI001CC43F39|nr:DNA mismatch repair protein [Arachidicoccus terrestris]UAY55740.1 DNA mismatch repair protein [Arachidicoccus terrestris]
MIHKSETTFITDRQTLEDLNLLGKYKTGSLFNLFNRVKTRGGELLLESMFRSPLTSSAAINERSEKIRYLQSLPVVLDIEWDRTEDASQYLTERRPSNKLSSYFGCYREKAQEVLYRSDKFRLQQKNIHAIQETLFSASQLLGALIRSEKSGNPLKASQERLAKILNAEELKQIKAKYPYTVGQTAHLQFLFLNKYRHEIDELLHLLYELDVYLSVADTARNKSFIYAEALEENTEDVTLLSVSNLKHPSLHGAVGNPLSLTQKQNLLFLTGANMAGKSTWMKTLGVSFYLAHMGFPVAASSMRFRVMEGIFTSINVPDNISIGWSHFYAEVMRVKQVSQEVGSGKRLFILFDELFKGTNVKDAYDATLAVTQRLARYSNCAFVISTHIIEVGDALKEIPSIQFKYMPTVMEGAVPTYTYRLTDGITEDRQGMIIIDNEGIFEMLE